MGLKILETASFLPGEVISNHYFEQRLDTSNEWIKERTGISNRYFATDITNFGMARRACLTLKNTRDIKLIIVATFSSEDRMPSMSSLLQKELGLSEDVFTVDINMACSGFVGASVLAEKYLENGQKALVVGSEKISNNLDMNDRKTCILFGDGCGAVVYQKTSDTFYFDCGTISNAEDLNLKDQKKIEMNGKQIFRFAVKKVPLTIDNVLNQSHQTIEQIDYFILHQANMRIIESVAHKLNIPRKKFLHNLEHVGNTSAASIPLLLDHCKDQIKDKQLLISGFGAGLVWASCLIEG